jgi:leucyl aminopeptidase
MMTLKTARGLPANVTTDALAFLVFEDARTFRSHIRTLTLSFALPDRPFAARTFSAKPGQTLLLFPRKGKARSVILVGMGKIKECTLEVVRRAGAAAAKAAEGSHARTLAVVDPAGSLYEQSPIRKEQEPWESFALALGEGATLGVYHYDKYLTKKSDRPSILQELTLVTTAKEKQKNYATGLSLARTIAEGTCLARDLENAPGNEIFPASLAEQARRWGKKTGVSVKVLSERKIRALKMGGLIGVSQGSQRPPRFIIMEYRRAASRRGRIVLVGKGVTFDSGGISIKPSGGMAEMKMDMSGAAAVIATVCTAARLKLPLHLIGLVPATENLPSGTALKPGDILRHLNGVTSEVDNTDAEGRLILADALAYADRYRPDLVIDLATLTGACVVALGHFATGMMGNDPAQMERLTTSGNRTHERVWELPMFEEYERLIKSDVADVKNVGGKWAGAITAAMFLRKFVGDNRWIHLDIAGTAMIEEPLEYVPKGGSGVGVRLLIDFLRHWKKG